MFKNSKFLKGITLVLALVLVLGAGVLVGSYVDAASKTVILYVSDHGDNSTGEDEATAFTTIDAAIAAADKMYLEAGSQLKLLVVDRVSVPTQQVDAQVLRDRTGARVPITITSYLNVTDNEDFSEVYFTFFTEDPTLPEASQKAVFYNDITFKNIRLNSQAQDVFSSAGESKGYYCVRRLYINGEKFTLDNVELTNEDSLKKAKWNIYPGGDTATGDYLNKEINFLNGDYYSKTTVAYVTNGDNPNTNYVFNVENAKMNYIYVVGGNANQVTVNYKEGADIYAQYYGSSGTKTVPGDVVINLEKGATLQNAWGSDDSAEYNFNLIQNFYGEVVSATNLGPKGDINGDSICNFYEGCKIGGNVTLGKYGGVTGTQLTNIYGGAFTGTVTMGKAEKTSASGMSNKTNRLVTNIEGGTFAKNVYLGPNVDGVIVGDVIATINGGTFSADVVGSGASRIDRDFRFYINGGEMKGGLRFVYGSSSALNGIGGDAYVKITNLNQSGSGKTVRSYQNVGVVGKNSTVIFDTTEKSTNSIVFTSNVDLCFGAAGQASDDGLVYVDGGENKAINFKGQFQGGSGAKRVINTIKNCTFGNLYSGMRDTGTQYLENNFENVTFSGAYYGCVSNNAIGGTYGAIVNSFKNCNLKKAYYGAGAGTATKVVGDVTNIFENTTTAETLYMGGNGSNKFAVGNITNYFKDSTLKAVTYCGQSNGDVNGNIKTTFIGGSQGNTFYGGNGSGGTVTGNITNIFDSVTVKKGLVAGSKAGTVGGDISSTFTNCECLGGTDITVVCSVPQAVKFNGAISAVFNGGSYECDIYALKDNITVKSVNMEINGGTFEKSVVGLYPSSNYPVTVEEDVYFTITSGEFNTTSGQFRALRPGGASVIKGDVICTIDTTGDPSNKVTSKIVFEVSMGYFNILGECILNVDGGENCAIDLAGLSGAMCAGNATNNVKNAKLANFRGARNNSEATPAGNLTNNLENVIITDYYYGASVSNSALNAYYNGTVTNNLKNVSVAGSFYGGAASTKVSTIANIVNNITDCTFTGTYFLPGSYATANGCGDITGTVVTNIYSAEIKASKSAYVCTWEARKIPAQLNLIPTAGPIVLGSSLLRYDVIENISLKGGEYPIVLDADATFTLAEYDGAPQKFIQSQSWTADKVYVTFPENAELSAITIFNGSSSVTGNGVIDGNVIKGAATSATAPALKSASFHLGDALSVRFWVEASEVEAWINANGNWSYSIDFMGKTLQSATFTSMDQFAAADYRDNGKYVTFLADLEITSILYGETITVAMAGGVSEDYTVYEILDLGVNYYETIDPESATLMKAIYNYGAEAYNVLCDGNVEVKYASQVSAPQDYTGSASATGDLFYATGISLDEKVTLNFYLNVADLNQLAFTAINSKGTVLPNSAISVKAVEGVAEYNAVVSLKLTIPQMAEIYTLSVQAGGATVATCTNSVTYACMTYINPQGSTPANYAPVAKALLSFIEASLPVVSR